MNTPVLAGPCEPVVPVVAQLSLVALKKLTSSRSFYFLSLVPLSFAWPLMSRGGPNKYYVADLDSPSTTNLLTPKQPSVQAALARGPRSGIKSTLSSTSLVRFYHLRLPFSFVSHAHRMSLPILQPRVAKLP